jgi:hypothetical protein
LCRRKADPTENREKCKTHENETLLSQAATRADKAGALTIQANSMGCDGINAKMIVLGEN